MPPEPPKPPAESGLIIQRGGGLVTLPNGRSPALSEMISRSLVHIRTGKALAVPGRRPGEECDFEIAPEVMMRMCWIPPGEFLMGSPEDELGRCDDETQHLVTITQGFWLGKYQVTQAQWEAVMEYNPSHFKGTNLPVERVQWDEILGTGDFRWYPNAELGGFLARANRCAAAGGSFSLPTEAQWEYACRAGTTTALNNGKNLRSTEGACRNLDQVAWYLENSGEETHPVGMKKANAWGLHDMHGNSNEWCADWYGDYPTEPMADPLGPDSGTDRVVRGGGWEYYARHCRTAHRNYVGPGSFNYGDFGNIGFRIARSSVPQQQPVAE